MSTEASDGDRNMTVPPQTGGTKTVGAGRGAGNGPQSGGHPTGHKQAAENAENEPAG